MARFVMEMDAEALSAFGLDEDGMQRAISTALETMCHPDTGGALYSNGGAILVTADSDESGSEVAAFYNAAINYAVDKAGFEADTFLRLWREGGWPEIHEEFPDFKLPPVALKQFPELQEKVTS